MRHYLTLFLISFVMLLASCSGTTENTQTSDCLTENPSFEIDIYPIFKNNCLECHNENDYAKKADGNKMYNYEHIKAKAEEGLIIGNIKHEQGFINMPYRKKKLEECDIATIELWIKNGSPNN